MCPLSGLLFFVESCWELKSAVLKCSYLEEGPALNLAGVLVLIVANGKEKAGRAGWKAARHGKA